MRINSNILTAGVVAGLASIASAQVGTGGTITDRLTTFTIADYTGTGTGNGPGADLRVGGIGNPDHLDSAWWWFRQAGQTRESAFSGAVASVITGNQLRLDYVYADFTASMVFRVNGVRDGFGFLTEQLTIQNTSSRAIDIALFNVNNINVNGTAGNDSLSLVGANIVRFTDAGGSTGWRADYEGTEAFAFDSAGSVRGLMTNGAADNLAGTGSTRGAGDWEGGYQWNLHLSANEAATASATVTIVPAPGAAAAGIVVGLAGLRRRRR